MEDERLYFYEGKTLVEKKNYKTGCDEFEAAIKKFGVDSALEYFCTPEEKIKEFDFLKLKEKILKASNVYKIRWDENNLFVHFNNGGVYQYLDIPEKLSIGMSEAESPGAFLSREIKGNYRYARIE